MNPSTGRNERSGGRKGPLRLLSRYFLRGILVVTPAALTLYVTYMSFLWFDGLLDLEKRIGFRIPGLGLLVAVAVVTLVGFLASNLIARRLIGLAEGILTRPPLVRLVYTSIRDLIEAFVGDRKRFDQPVLVALHPGSDAKALGFVTRGDLDGLGLSGHVAVYLPQSYNFAGQLLVVPAERAVPLRADSTSVMSFIVSGGVSGGGVES